MACTTKLLKANRLIMIKKYSGSFSIIKMFRAPCSAVASRRRGDAEDVQRYYEITGGGSITWPQLLHVLRSFEL